MSFSGEVEGADMDAARIAGSSRGAVTMLAPRASLGGDARSASITRWRCSLRKRRSVAMLASQASLGGEYSRPALRAATDLREPVGAVVHLPATAIEEGRTRPR